MVVKSKHRAASGVKAGQWVDCNAGVKCRNGGVHVDEVSLWNARMMHLDKTGVFLAVGVVPLESMVEYAGLSGEEKARVAALEVQRVAEMRERSDARRARKRAQGKPAGGVEVVHVPAPKRVFNTFTSTGTDSGKILFSYDDWAEFKSELDGMNVAYTVGSVTKYRHGNAEYFGVDKIEINSDLSEGESRRVKRSLNRNMMVNHDLNVSWMKPHLLAAFQRSAEKVGVHVSYNGHSVYSGLTGNLKKQVFHGGIKLTGRTSDVNRLIDWLDSVAVG